MKTIPFKLDKSKINSRGFIINEASINKVQKCFLPALQEVKRIYLEKFSGKIYGINVRGSVAIGKAIKNISDLDMAVILKNKPTTKEKEWNSKTIQYLQKKFDYFTTIDITLLSKEELLKSNYYKNLKVYLKTSSFCLYGKDSAKFIKPIKANKELAAYLFSDITNELKKIKDKIENKKADKKYLGITRSNKFWCRWAMRITLRSALGLVMINKPIYSKNTKTCYLEFAKTFPKHKNLMEKIFKWELSPPSNAKKITSFLDTFIPFYEKLWEEELNKSNFNLNDYKKIKIGGTYKIGFDYAKKELGDISRKRTLDYGCGNGRSSLFLKNLGAKVYGIDLSEKAIELVRKSFKNRRNNFKVLSYDLKIPFKNKYFDVLFCSFVHPGIPNIKEMDKIHKEIRRVLRKGGLLVILTINPKMWGHEYKSCLSNFPENFRGRSGDKVNVVLKTKPKMKFQDYFWTKEDYTLSLKRAGFKKIKITETINTTEKVKIPPYLIIKAE